MFRCLLPLLLLLCSGTCTLYAQARYNADSAVQARRAQLEVTRTAQKHSLDSARIFRQHVLDSTRAVRARFTDSLKEVRAYRQSREYLDSVKSAREDRVAAIHEASKARLDSMKEARKHSTDSTIAAREVATAGIRRIQQRRTDSLAAIRAYKTSKRAADSIGIVKKARTDSIHIARKAFSDSLASIRKFNLEHLKAIRKNTTDSLAAVRKVHTDSLAVVRKARAAELAKKKDNQLRDKKLTEKKQANKAAIAIEVKIKSKRAKFSNENMLKKKWSPPRRALQNTFTHYNYYFNAKRKMEEAELNMQRAAKDKWDERITLLPFDPLRDSALFASDMDSVIQKASIGIQIHDPRTKWGDDLYLLLGQAYYYKGDKDNAEASFRYIIALQEKLKAEEAKRHPNSTKSSQSRHEAPSYVTPEKKGTLSFLKREPATNDGLLWLARTYTSYGAYEQSESVLDLLGADAKFPEDLRGRLALERALLALKRRDDKEAAANLAIVSADKGITNYIRRRAAYLDGQILQSGGNYTAAAAQYALVSDLNPKIDMDFYARRNRAYSLMQAGGVQSDAIASLKSMLGDGKFAPYYEQVYYVLGRLSANSGKTDDAITYLQSGIAAPKATRKGKAASFAALGNIYFNTGEYGAAKNSFDSVARYASAAPDDSGVVLATRRSLVVDKIATPAGIVRRQDSLLTLGSMTDKEQRAVVRRYLRTLQAQRADSIFRAENGGVVAALTTDNAATGSEGATMSWYFANPTLIQQGITEFKRKWGSRSQVDNWRRSSALAAAGNTLAGTGNDPSGNDGANGDNSVDESGLPTEEALMSYIPTTPESRAVATGRMQRAYVDVATAYIRQFEDYRRAGITLDTFEHHWPQSPYGAEATYLRYLIALGTNSLKDATKWSAKLQQDYSTSEWAALVAPPPSDNGSDNGPLTASVGDYYDATYDLLQQRQYGEVLSRSRSARRQFATNEGYLNRFRIMEAMAYAGSAQWSQADTILSTFIRTHSGDPLQPWAEQVLSFVTAHKKVDTLIAKPATSAQPSLPPVSASTATSSSLPNAAATTGNLAPVRIDSGAGPVPAEYTYHPQEAHYFIFAANKMETKVMGVKAGLGDLNSFKFADQSLETFVEPMSAGRAIVVVRAFKNAAAAKAYVAQFRYAPQLVREFNANEYQTLIISASNFRKLMSDRGLGSYLPFYRAHY